jgi:hypothetical protein
VTKSVTFGMGKAISEKAMTDLVNVLLWYGMFAIPMSIVVVMRHLGRKHGWDDGYPSGDPSQEPDYRRRQ